MAPQTGNVIAEPATRARRTRRPRDTQSPRRTDSSNVILEALPSAFPARPATLRHGDPAGREPTHEQVRTRAYQLYLARGRQDGHHVEDWLQAERELRAELSL